MLSMILLIVVVLAHQVFAPYRGVASSLRREDGTHKWLTR